MKKSATVGLLLIVILLSLGFVVLKSQALGSPSNYFNRNLRRDFATSPLFREILGLHYYRRDSSEQIILKRSLENIVTILTLGTPRRFIFSWQTLTRKTMTNWVPHFVSTASCCSAESSLILRIPALMLLVATSCRLLCMSSATS